VKYNARAKINLFLHVTGRRDDSYHLLESLVMFTKDIYDELSFNISKHHTTLAIEGPFSKLLNEDNNKNLIIKAIEKSNYKKGLNILLKKNIPLGAGIGGGSSDAAITIKALQELFNHSYDDLNQLLLSIGADVPVCCKQKASYFTGVGEIITTIHKVPQIYALLVNPGIHINTKEVFASRPNVFSPKISQKPIEFSSFSKLIEFLEPLKNDLESSTIKLVSQISTIINEIKVLPGCRIARMSGSGPTCFGLFETEKEVIEAQDILTSKHPYWWIQHSPLV
jgi:4-diphosphocytidyl-2-C-methyl-D-erythritol kinase